MILAYKKLEDIIIFYKLGRFRHGKASKAWLFVCVMSVKAKNGKLREYITQVIGRRHMRDWHRNSS